MTLKMLDSGYWFARWNGEVWAQWPRGRECRYDDFFHPSFSASDARINEANRRAVSTCAQPETGES